MDLEADWGALRAEYVRGRDSYRALAARHGVPLGRLAARARREGWPEARAAEADGREQTAGGGTPPPQEPPAESRSSCPRQGPAAGGEPLFPPAAPGAAGGAPLTHLSLAADNVVLLADRAARGLVDAAGRVDLDGLAKVAKILKDARDTQLAVLPAADGGGGTDDGFCAALNARAAQVWEADGDG